MKFNPVIELEASDTKRLANLVMEAIKAESEKVMSLEDTELWRWFMNELEEASTNLANKAFQSGFEAGKKHR
jgi:succinate dehydrogenase flavin-adding protein (antitoxin of CptAB toxin-antitoxin module)